ncbi:MAG: protein kinase [Proteobacteria bacterium]|nr:protein kinase [Pseudomonadota bacterium]
MGTVFLARDTQLGRLVALKFLPASDAVTAEARKTARCRHDNIVVIYEIGEHRGQPFMALEYIEGHTLQIWREERLGAARVPPMRAAELMIPAVRALAHAHDMGIVHRDLKPANIMLTESGAIKLLDFGVAKELSRFLPAAAVRNEAGSDAGPSSSVVASRRVGTPPYMAPEQLRGERVDDRCDMWAVGIILYELVIGVHPLHPVSLDLLIDEAHEVERALPRTCERSADAGEMGDIIDRCLRKRTAERIPTARALLVELEGFVRRKRESADRGNQCPFAGLSSFQESDAASFYGRSQDIVGLENLVRGTPLAVVVGPSGAGKSSLVRAGLIPALKQSGEDWEALIVRPGRSSVTALAAALQVDLAADSLIDRLRTQPGYLGTVLRAKARATSRRIVLFVDQFEELYTLAADDDQVGQFCACLAGVADDSSSPLRLIVGIRSDFLDRLAEDRQLMARATLYFVSPMSRRNLREALIRPLDGVGYRFDGQSAEPGGRDDNTIAAPLVEEILDALGSTSTPLPLLQCTASMLWERRDRGRKLLTHESYEKIGGVAGTLAAHADSVLAGLGSSRRRIARNIFERLVTPERTRALVRMGELRQLRSDRAEIEYVVDNLAKSRLLVIHTDIADAEHEGSQVELIHESLIYTWPTLRRWLEEDQEEAQFCTRLRMAAREWEQRGRMEELLWRGPLASEAKRWQAHWRTLKDQDSPNDSYRHFANLSDRDQQFLETVIALATRVRRRRQQFAAAAFALLGVVALVISVLAVQAHRSATRADEQAKFAQKQASQASEQAREAEEQAIVARNATRMATAREKQADPTLVLALVRELEPSDPPRQWRELARWAMHEGVARVVLEHPAEVGSAAFSPDGTRVVTASADKTVLVWSADGNEKPLILRGHLDRVRSAVFSPDGTQIITASDDKTARLWSADGSGQPLILRGHLDRVYSAAFSPDGSRIVTASSDKTARVWNADGSGQPLVLRGHRFYVSSAGFSPDGARIVTASLDKTVRVWNADGSGEPIVLRGHDDFVQSAAFSPDGTRIVTASYDKTARVWNADGSGQPLVFRGHLDRVWSAAFSPDGKHIVTASLDKTARVWNADGSGQPLVIRGHLDVVWSAAFSPDGTHVVTASSDKFVRVWDADGSGQPVILRGHLERVGSATFSPDGAHIVTASSDKTARVWSADGSGQPVVLRGHDDRVWSAAFSPDGTRIATASWDRTARVWNTDGSGRALVFRGHENIVRSVAFSPDGARIVTASSDKTARVWNADGSGQPLVLRGHLGRVWSAAFSPDGTRIVTASWDKTARVWNADGSGPILVLRGHQDVVWSAAFSPDGTRIVTASADKTARVWNADGSGQPLLLLGHEGSVFAGAFGGQGAFHPDGKRIVTVSGDKTIRLWNVDSPRNPLIIRAPALDAFSAAFSPDGTRIVTSSHSARIVATSQQIEHVEHTAKVWRNIEPLTGLEDPKLWVATRYCPSVEQRIKLLSVPEQLAVEKYERCLQRIALVRANDEF